MYPLLEWFAKVHASGLTPEERRKFISVLWRMLLSLQMLWAFGLLGPNSGFASTREIDRRVQATLTPVLNELKKMRTELERSNEHQRKILIEGVISRIRELQRACLSLPQDSVARNRLAVLIENSQLEYMTLTRIDGSPGERYPLNPQCE